MPIDCRSIGSPSSPQPSPPRRRTLFASAATIALLLAALFGIAWTASERAIHPSAAHYAKGLADFPELHPRQVGFNSRTQTRIAGWFFPARRRTTIVLSHGFGDNQAQMLPYAAFLVRQGFSILTYDMRSRGSSGGDAVTFGGLESLDLSSAVDYLMTRSDVDRDRIGAMGVSLGGATTILAAASDSRIKAVVDDSGFSDVPSAVRNSFEHFIRLPPVLFAPMTVFIARLRTGIDMNRISPVDVIARISPRPVLIIHCMTDKVLLPDNSERNFRAAGEPKYFWRIPAGDHVGGLEVAGQEYERRVSQFFDSLR